MRQFRLYKRGNAVYIQEYKPTLFGMMWSCVHTFTLECEAECREVVRLLNKCKEKSQDNDTGRDIAT